MKNLIDTHVRLKIHCEIPKYLETTEVHIIVVVIISIINPKNHVKMLTKLQHRSSETSIGLIK